jgi:hypothetical protein
VPLQEREERVHGGVVADGADLAHSSGPAVAGQRPVQFPGTKLRSPVGVKDAASDLTAAGDRGLDSVGEPQPVRGRGVERAAVQIVMSRSGTMSSDAPGK